MATTLPSLTETLDNAFLHTWYQIRPQATDNILRGTPLMALLKEKGCFKKQVGGRLITRTVFYDYVSPSAVTKGSSLGEGETETETMAVWTWRYLASPIQRSVFDDQKNSGPDKIRDYVSTKIERARQGFKQKHETDFFNTHVTDETGTAMQGLNDLIPPTATRATGTYGKINRPTNFTLNVPDAGNTWWSPKYDSITGPIDVTLVTDMRRAFNTVYANQEKPDAIVTDQTTYELYEEFGTDAAQIMMNGTTKKILDLGFDSCQFKGATMIWTPNITASNLLYLTTEYLDVVYDPNMWASMSHWKDAGGGKTGERLAHILTALNVVSDQPRRFLRQA